MFKYFLVGSLEVLWITTTFVRITFYISAKKRVDYEKAM